MEVAEIFQIFLKRDFLRLDMQKSEGNTIISFIEGKHKLFLFMFMFGVYGARPTVFEDRIPIRRTVKERKT